MPTPEELEKQLKDALDKIEALNAEAKKYRLGKKELSEQLEKFDGLDPDEIKELKKKAHEAEQERLKAEGKFEEALKKATSELQAENEALRTQLQSKDEKLTNTLIDSTVKSAIADKAINPDQVLSLIKPNIKMDGDSPVVYKGDAPMLDDKGQKVSVADYAAKFLESNPHFVKPGKQGSGSRGNEDGGQEGSGQTMKRTDYDGLDATSKAEFAKSGGKIVD